MSDRLRVLFVCSRNAWRSPTAERVWRDDSRLAVRSAGTSPRARRTVSARDLDWADVVLVMEPRHRDRLRERFGDAARRADLRVRTSRTTTRSWTRTSSPASPTTSAPPSATSSI